MDGVVLVEVGVGGMDAVVEATVLVLGEGEEGAGVLSDVTQECIEVVIFEEGIVILEASEGGIVGMEAKGSQFFEVVVKEGNPGGVRFFIQGVGWG